MPAEALPAANGLKAGSRAAAAPAGPLPFWKKPLEALTRTEWERLCDGCGRCCLVKLEDEDTGRIHYTDVACRLLEAGTCRCSNYGRRRERVPDCVKLTPQTVRALPWLPPTCAYRLRAEGRDLPSWHPLVSGDPESVHRAGVSVRGRIGAGEEDVPVDDLPDYIVSWPARVPKSAR
jgi:uncharacterized cysteine cluster protein YcgN (CxxCxxCC family)